MQVKCFMNSEGKFYRAEADDEDAKGPQPKSSGDMEKPVISAEGLEALTLEPVSQQEWDERIRLYLAKK